MEDQPIVSRTTAPQGKLPLPEPLRGILLRGASILLATRFFPRLDSAILFLQSWKYGIDTGATMPSLKQADAVEALSALAHEGRLAIFRLLVKAGPDGVAAGEIARKLDILPNTLSASLTLLSHAGLIASRREGRSIIYSADYAWMSRLLGFLMEDCCNGNASICAPLVDIANRAACCG